MKLVVDTNILFSFFKKESFTRKIIVSNKTIKLISPTHSLKELNKYSQELLSKSKLTKNELESVLLLLHSYVKFVPLAEYKEQFKNAIHLAKGFSKKEYKEFIDDIDFFSLALKENCPIWSKDKLFKKQLVIKVLDTKDLAKLFPSTLT